MRTALGTLTAAIVLLGSWVSPAHADRTFTPRFTADAAGDITLVANTLMTCPDASAECATARAGTNPTLGNNNDNAFAMGYVDADSDPATFNSSSATLALPPGSSVLFAGLYYGADVSTRNGGAAPPDAVNRDRVKFRAPGDTGYSLLGPAVVDDSTIDPGRYQGFVDVTNRVRAAGVGTYTVADVQAGTGGDHYAGWSLVIAYRDEAQVVRNLTVFDGQASILNNAPPTDIPVTGFRTPPSGTVRASVGFVIYEGDLGILGDTASLLTSRGTFPLADARNPADNYFNSSVSRLGNVFTAKAPDYVNQLGYDADLLDADGFLGNNDTSASIRVTTNGDQYLPGVVTFSSELLAPRVVPSKSVSDVTEPGGTVRPGHVLRYSLSYANTGQDAANNLVARDSIPANTTYVPGSLRIAGGGSPTDAAGDDAGEFDAAGGLVRFRLGDLAPGGTVGATFDVRVNPATAANTTVSNIALADFTGATVGTAFTNVPSPPAVVTVGEPLPAPPLPTPTAVPSAAPTAAGAQSDLHVRKEVDRATASVGDVLRYQVVVENRGDGAADGVRVDDTPSGAVDLLSVQASAGSCTSVIPVRCALGTIAPHSLVTIRMAFRLTRPGLLTNTATLTAADGETIGDSQSVASTNVTGGSPPRPRLAVRKRASRATVRAGETAAFRIRVRNRGTTSARLVTVCDRLPRGLSFASGRGASFRAGRACWSIARLKPGASRTFTLRVRAQGTAAGARVRNVAAARGANAGRQTGSAQVRILPAASRVGGVTG